MPTLITHAIAPVVARVGLGPQRISNRLLAVACCAAVLPDADVVAFLLGIPYGDPLGHRGISHSLMLALLAGFACSFAYRWLQSKRLTAFLFVSVSMASHGLFDALTNGGLGVAFFWPFSDARYFFPSQPIEVSAIGLKYVFTERMLIVLKSELLWVWFPSLTLAWTLRATLLNKESYHD